MTRPSPLDRQLAELFSRFVRLSASPERDRLGEALDRLAAQILTNHQPKERSDGISESDEDSGEAAVHV